MKKRCFTFFICILLILSLLPVGAAAQESAGEAWISQGEFLAMLSNCVSLRWQGKLTGVHPAEYFWHALKENGILNGVDISCTAASLDSRLRRYEMAVMVNNVLTGILQESDVDVSAAPYVIPDYESVYGVFRSAVSQVYAKGVVSGIFGEEGIEDGAFCGERGVTAEQADQIIHRIAAYSARVPVDMADRNPYRLADAPNGTAHFAQWLQTSGLLRGTEPTPAFNELMFGNAEKTGFENDEDAAPYMMTIRLNVWAIDNQGNRFPTVMDLYVHKYLAADVWSIFQQIFEDEEKFPILTLGCIGYGDSHLHSWGCAIDINSRDNCEAHAEDGRIILTGGSGWWPTELESSVWACALNESSPYSIPAGGSVVSAFKEYGWGWGGAWNGSWRDFMHFSIRPDGG